MSLSWKRALGALSIACLAGLPGIVGGQDAPAPPAAERLEIVLEDEPAGRAFLFTQGAAPAADPAAKAEEPTETADRASEYWIGVQLEPLPEIITSQLKLERGMVVVQVFEDSPAAKAELKTNDIIVRAGEKDVKGPDDLIAAVNEAQENPLAIVVLRGGTETTLKVTPTKRSPELTQVLVYPATEQRVIVQKLDELQKQTPDGEVHMFAVGPGAVRAYAIAMKFPDNLNVEIEKHGNKPATIRATRIQEGTDKSWEVTEDKLSELPADIRGHVQQLLGHRAIETRTIPYRAPEHVRSRPEYHLSLKDARVRGYPHPPQPRATAARATPVIADSAAESRIGAKLDAILEKLDRPQDADVDVERLEKELEKLRKEVETLRQEKK